MLKRLAKLPVHGYRYLVSPLWPACCRYRPTCSRYMLDAIDKYGPVRGIWRGIRRIARCHPIAALGGGEGHDPA